MTIPIAEQIECVERELKLRRRVYPRRVAENKLAPWTADREIARMTAVLATLQKVGKEQGELPL